MRELILVGLGGFLGAVARYGLTHWLQRSSDSAFPWGILTANVLGCLLLGVLMGLVDRESVNPQIRLFCGVGLLGAFTTFSTFGYDTLVLLRDRMWTGALGNVAMNVLLGLLAVWIGHSLVHRLIPTTP